MIAATDLGHLCIRAKGNATLYCAAAVKAERYLVVGQVRQAAAIKACAVCIHVCDGKAADDGGIFASLVGCCAKRASTCAQLKDWLVVGAGDFQGDILMGRGSLSVSVGDSNSKCVVAFFASVKTLGVSAVIIKGVGIGVGRAAAGSSSHAGCCRKGKRALGRINGVFAIAVALHGGGNTLDGDGYSLIITIIHIADRKGIGRGFGLGCAVKFGIVICADLIDTAFHHAHSRSLSRRRRNSGGIVGPLDGNAHILLDISAVVVLRHQCDRGSLVHAFLQALNSGASIIQGKGITGTSGGAARFGKFEFANIGIGRVGACRGGVGNCFALVVFHHHIQLAVHSGAAGKLGGTGRRGNAVVQGVAHVHVLGNKRAGHCTVAGIFIDSFDKRYA